MDKSWKKGYKGVYKKINKNNYSSWKKNVQQDIAENDEESLENLKKEYEIKMYRAKIGLDKENFPTFAYNYFGVMITLVTVIVSLYIAFSNILYGILQDKCSYIEDYERKGKVYDNLLDQMSGDWSKMISTITIFFLAIIILYIITYFNDKRCVEKNALQVSYCEEILKIIEEEQK